MYFCMRYGLLIIYISLVLASFNLRRSGWLDKVVEYHKSKLFEDFKKLPAVKIKATLQVAPPGYVDSALWDFVSVTHLLNLIRESETALPVRRALQKMLGGRRTISFQETLVAFPSLNKDNINYLYYDVDSEYDGELASEEMFPGDEAVIVVSNPVEARLPSAMISVSLMRQILENRAKAGRFMPTTRNTIPWKTMTKSSTREVTEKSTAEDNESNIVSTLGTGATGTANDGPTTAAA